MVLKKLLFSSLIAMFLAVALAVPAYAASPQVWCEDTGGIWGGANENTGSCYFEEMVCAGAGFTYYAYVYVDGVMIDAACTNDSPDIGGEDEAGTGDGSSGNPGTPGGPYGNEVHDPYETTLCVKDPKNGCVTFVGAQHVHKCAITPNLPVGAAAELPPGTVAVLYVNVVEMEDVSDTHTVCFNTEGIENPVLYQYIAGEWVKANAGGYGGQICTTHSGDGSFALASE